MTFIRKVHILLSPSIKTRVFFAISLENQNIQILIQTRLVSLCYITTWFNDLKAQLSDDVVANLQYQIGEKVNKSDKATLEDAIDGTNNELWMTPASVKSSIGANSDAHDLDGNRVKLVVSNELAVVDILSPPVSFTDFVNLKTFSVGIVYGGLEGSTYTYHIYSIDQNGNLSNILATYSYSISSTYEKRYIPYLIKIPNLEDACLFISKNSKDNCYIVRKNAVKKISMPSVAIDYTYPLYAFDYHYRDDNTVVLYRRLSEDYQKYIIIINLTTGAAGYQMVAISSTGGAVTLQGVFRNCIFGYKRVSDAYTPIVYLIDTNGMNDIGTKIGNTSPFFIFYSMDIENKSFRVAYPLENGEATKIYSITTNSFGYTESTTTITLSHTASIHYLTQNDNEIFFLTADNSGTAIEVFDTNFNKLRVIQVSPFKSVGSSNYYHANGYVGLLKAVSLGQGKYASPIILINYLTNSVVCIDSGLYAGSLESGGESNSPMMLYQDVFWFPLTKRSDGVYNGGVRMIKCRPNVFVIRGGSAV